MWQNVINGKKAKERASWETARPSQLIIGVLHGENELGLLRLISGFSLTDACFNFPHTPNSSCKKNHRLHADGFSFLLSVYRICEFLAYPGHFAAAKQFNQTKSRISLYVVLNVKPFRHSIGFNYSSRLEHARNLLCLSL